MCYQLQNRYAKVFDHDIICNSTTTHTDYFIACRSSSCSMSFPPSWSFIVMLSYQQPTEWRPNLQRLQGHIHVFFNSNIPVYNIVVCFTAAQTEDTFIYYVCIIACRSCSLWLLCFLIIGSRQHKTLVARQHQAVVQRCTGSLYRIYSSSKQGTTLCKLSEGAESVALFFCFQTDGIFITMFFTVWVCLRSRPGKIVLLVAARKKNAQKRGYFDSFHVQRFIIYSRSCC